MNWHDDCQSHRLVYTLRSPNQNVEEKHMKNAQLTALKSLLTARGVAPEIIAEVTRLIGAPQRHAGWQHITAPLDAAIKSMANGRTRWRNTRADLYGAYLQLMEKTRGVIQTAVHTYETPNDAAAEAAAANAARAAQGKRPMGECKSHWSTWVPPHVREATCLAFEELYAKENLEEGRAPGRRVHPFTTLAERGDISRKWEALRKQLQIHINAGPELHPAVAELETRGMDDEQQGYHAQAMERVHRERYRAAVQARKTIDARKGYLTDPANIVVPIHWTHMLDEDARARLRDAEKAIGGDGYTRDTSTYAFHLPHADSGPEAPEGRIIDVEPGYMGESQ